MSTASETSVANIAMAHLGQEPITNIDADNNKRAKWARRRFDTLRDALLRSHPWDFATKLTSVAASTAVPAYGFGYRYTLPADFLRLVRLYQEDALFRVRDGSIHTDLGAPLEFEYIYRNVVTTSWTDDFAEVMGLALAYAICLPITDDRQLRKELKEDFRLQLALAKGTEAQEKPNEEWDVDIWLFSRY